MCKRVLFTQEGLNERKPILQKKASAWVLFLVFYLHI